MTHDWQQPLTTVRWQPRKLTRGPRKGATLRHSRCFWPRERAALFCEILELEGYENAPKFFYRQSRPVRVYQTWECERRNGHG